MLFVSKQTLLKDFAMKKKTRLAINKGALEFFNSLSGFLHVELTKEAKPWKGSTLMNVFATPDAKIKEVGLDCQVFTDDDADDLFRELTDDEWKQVVIKAPSIKIAGLSGDVVEHKSAKGQFTIEDLVAAVEKTERKTRGNTDWFGGIDVHHVCFEGIEKNKDGVWETCWGS